MGHRGVVGGVKDTWQCIKGLLCLRYKEAFATFARILFHLLEKQRGLDGGVGEGSKEM